MNLNFRDITSKLSTRGWLTVGASALVGVLFIYLLLSFASSPSYSSLVAGQSPTQAAKVTSALSAAGIPYQLLNGGTAVSVEASKVGQARDILSTQGLLLGGGSSTSLESYLGKTSLGADSMEQQEQSTSATEQQLDDTIESMNGINSAEVELSVPDATDSLFADTTTQASSSVLLNTNGNLGASAVKAIAQLVTNAVTGLSSSHVTITDQNGDLLWPSSASTGGSSLSAEQTAENAYDTQKSEAADAYLAATIGANKALVQVAATLNTNQQTISSVKYAKKGTPYSSTIGTEKLTGAGTGTTATGNTATQLASVAGNANNGTSKYNTNTTATQLDVGKTISQQKVTPGKVTRQTISVLVNSTVPASEIATIQSAVQNSMGYVAGRDQISVGTVTFPKAVTAAPGSSSSKMFGDVKYVLIGLGALAFLFFMRRGLRRSENEQFAGSPTWLRELDAPRALSELEGGQPQMVDLEGGDPVSVARLRSPINVARQQVEELVDRDPERVASQIRQWMTED